MFRRLLGAPGLQHDHTNDCRPNHLDACDYLQARAIARNIRGCNFLYLLTRVVVVGDISSTRGYQTNPSFLCADTE